MALYASIFIVRQNIRRFLFLLLAPVVCFFIFAFVYAPHILFFYGTYLGEENNKYIIRNRFIKPADVPDDWTLVDLAGVTLRLPKDYSPSRRQEVGLADRDSADITETFRNGRCNIDVRFSPDYFLLYDTRSEKIRFLPDKAHLTFPEIRIASNQISSDSFSFSMSYDELKWLRVLLSVKNLGVDKEGDDTELLVINKIYSCITYSSRGKFASVDWQLEGSTFGGYIGLSFKDGKIDREFVRSLCSSLRVKEKP